MPQQILFWLYFNQNQHNLFCKNNKVRADPGGNGPALTAGTLGVTAGVMLPVGCLVAAAPEAELEAEEEAEAEAETEAEAEAEAGAEAEVEFLSEPVDGLESGAGEGPEAGVRTGVSEPDWPSLPSAGAEPLLEDAEEIMRHHRVRSYCF